MNTLVYMIFKVLMKTNFQEIALGIIGNLACHEVSRKQIASVKGLVELIVDQLFVDDTPCLCEEFRYVLAIGSVFYYWV